MSEKSRVNMNSYMKPVPTRRRPVHGLYQITKQSDTRQYEELGTHFLQCESIQQPL